MISGHEGELLVELGEDEQDWIHEVLEAARPGEEPLLIDEAREVYPGDWERFETQVLPLLSRAGLLKL